MSKYAIPYMYIPHNKNSSNSRAAKERIDFDTEHSASVAMLTSFNVASI